MARPDGRLFPNGQRRAAVAKSAAELAEWAPQAMREHLAPFVPEFCDGLMAVYREPKLVDSDGNETSNPAWRTAATLIPQILKAVGAQTELTINLWARIGAADETEARQLVGMAREVSNLDDDATAREAMRFLQEYRARRGLPALIEPAREIAQDGRSLPSTTPNSGKD